MFTIGIDVGGTYTDLVATDSDGRTVFAKSPSTPDDQSIGVMAGLDELARRLNTTRAEMLAATDRLVHGTTVATNALLEHKGAKVALLTTEGHRDVLEMREGLKPDRYDLRSPPPEPLVPRERRFGVRERLRADGEVLIPLDRSSLDAAIATIRASGANSVAVCFLHAYLNPVHEIAAAERLRRELPDLNVSRSGDVLPQIKEYERVSTTVVNAYVEPVVRRYLTNLAQRLSEAGFRGSLFVVLSHGGMAPVEEASRLAAGTVLSGPAGGISGSRRCADLLGIPDLVPFDMGGTSTDISLISGGHVSLSADGIRLMTLRRGVDPRKFSLLSFGGAAGLHAAEVARELEIRRIVVPTVASVLSAWGMLTSDLRYEVSRTRYGTARISPEEVRDLFAALEQQAAGRLRGWFDGPISTERSAEMRYGEQVFEIDVALDGLEWNAADIVERIEDRFHHRHEELYTYASRGQEVVFVNARVAAIGEVAQRRRGDVTQTAQGICSPRAKRRAYLGEWREVPVYALDDLKPGHSLAGPAIIEAETTTVLIDTGDRVTVNALGWLDIVLR